MESDDLGPMPEPQVEAPEVAPGGVDAVPADEPEPDPVVPDLPIDLRVVDVKPPD
jgi:hypothetical protein